MNWDILNVTNIMRIYNDVQDIRQLPAAYWAVNKIPSVEAFDGEIMARYTGRVLAADIIANDQKAVVRSANPIRLTQTTIPNLKHGEMLTQEQLEILQRIQAGNASRRDNAIFEDYIARRVIELRDGVYARMEALLWAMLTDAFSYNRLGIIVSGGTWGMPSDLKVTVSVLWTVANAATATPVTDILTVKRIAAQKYGVMLDRITLPTAVILALPAITEFKNFASLHLNLTLPNTGFNTQDTATTATLFGAMIGMEVEVYDQQTWTEAEDGSQTAVPYLPVNQVVLTCRAFDGDSSKWDWANGLVTETIPGIVPAMVGSFGDVATSGEDFGAGPRSGPVGYATGADPQGNPPGIILWGVGRGFPRRHWESCSAVLTVQ